MIGLADAPVTLVPVESSMLTAVGYDASTRELEAVFASGEVWRYENVPRRVYNELLDSDSKGRYMRTFVIGMYAEHPVTAWRR